MAGQMAPVCPILCQDGQRALLCRLARLGERKTQDADVRVWDAYVAPPHGGADLDHMAIIIATISTHMTAPEMLTSAAVCNRI